MMLAELTQVLDRVPVAAPMQSYLDAIVEDNVLGKPTRSTRQKTAKRLTELFALDPGCPSFRLLRFYWSEGAKGRPMLAFLLACARDSLIRDATPHVLAVPRDRVVTPGEVVGWLTERYPGRFQISTLNSTARNLSSSWTQAGLLGGAREKRRSEPRV